MKNTTGIFAIANDAAKNTGIQKCMTGIAVYAKGVAKDIRTHRSTPGMGIVAVDVVWNIRKMMMKCFGVLGNMYETRREITFCRYFLFQQNMFILH